MFAILKSFVKNTVVRSLEEHLIVLGMVMQPLSTDVLPTESHGDQFEIWIALKLQ